MSVPQVPESIGCGNSGGQAAEFRKTERS
jgi:hypothetical protein